MANTMLNDKTFSPEAVAKQRAAGGAGTMTIGATVLRSAVLLALLLLTASYGWSSFYQILGTSPWMYVAYWVVLLGISFGAALVPKASPILAPLYALLSGLWIGAISKVYAAAYDGIVTQAVLCTVAVFAAVLVLYTLRIVRVSTRFIQVVMAATLGMLVLYLGLFVAALFGFNAFAITPLGIGISLVAAIIASMNLFVDLRFIEDGVNAGAPMYMAWYGAFGLLATLIWLYLEILRLLSYLRD
jgi:uncharacterized YccA/Bax inhibitor family protein